MPGLLRGVARTAVVAGTASAVSGRVQRRQSEKFADRDAQIAAERNASHAQQVSSSAPAPAAGADAPDLVAQLKGLAELRDQGVLTDEEFAAQNAKFLSR